MRGFARLSRPYEYTSRTHSPSKRGRNFTAARQTNSTSITASCWHARLWSRRGPTSGRPTTLRQVPFISTSGSETLLRYQGNRRWRPRTLAPRF
ncbi:hypothetical protein JG688_00016538 [Phytophthora aleatoria]|uniref:Uncharacterized protein n=1 Tax=Phytophthora aleatoria TaxID=2496075 RepID=A0A8J5MCT4_9STRA|nr:hypothetical protein JG688_00016538 [Phytophthora aleatoria]